MAKKEPTPIRFPPSPENAELFARVVEIAKTFPGCEESRSYGTPAIKVRQKFVARLRTEGEGSLAICCDLMERDMLMMASPGTFYITDHYANSDMVLINLETVRWDAMPGIIEQAWRMVATAKLIREYEEREA